jgi:hypothetical protein
VRVLDKFNLPQSHVPVYFITTAGGGTVEEESVWTDASGYAEVRWKMGTEYGIEQQAEAFVRQANGDIIGTPIKFKAKTPTLIGNWTLASFANGVLPGTLVDGYVEDCPNILQYRYSELIDNYAIDSTRFSNFNKERVMNTGVTWSPETCTVVSPGTATDSTYETTIAGTYTVSNNVVTYTSDSGEVASYSFQFITFNRLKVDENEYVR